MAYQHLSLVWLHVLRLPPTVSEATIDWMAGIPCESRKLKGRPPALIYLYTNKPKMGWQIQTGHSIDFNFFMLMFSLIATKCWWMSLLQHEEMRTVCILCCMWDPWSLCDYSIFFIPYLQYWGRQYPFVFVRVIIRIN